MWEELFYCDSEIDKIIFGDGVYLSRYGEGDIFIEKENGSCVLLGPDDLVNLKLAAEKAISLGWDK